MSGPIVRSGPSEKFTANWDSVFSSGKKSAKAEKTESKSAAAKTPKKKPKTSKKK